MNTFPTSISGARFPLRTTTDLHAVYATLANGVRVMVSGDLSWDGAQDRWLALDDRRRAGEKLHVGDFIAHVAYFSVRSMEDPKWPSAQPNHAIETAAERWKREWREVCDFLVGA